VHLAQFFVHWFKPTSHSSIQTQWIDIGKCWHSALGVTIPSMPVHLTLSKLQHGTAIFNTHMHCWCYLFRTLSRCTSICTLLDRCNCLHHFCCCCIALNLIFTTYSVSPIVPNFLSWFQQMDPTPTSAERIFVTRSLWKCLGVIGLKSQGGQIAEFTGPTQWPSGPPGSTSEWSGWTCEV